MSQLAVVGGKPVVEKADETLFHWPIVNQAINDTTPVIGGVALSKRKGKPK